MFLISEWHGPIIVALIPITLNNTNLKHVPCDGGNTFVHCIFNATIFIHSTILFVFAITWCYGSFVCFVGTFVMPFNYLTNRASWHSALIDSNTAVLLEVLLHNFSSIKSESYLMIWGRWLTKHAYAMVFHLAFCQVNWLRGGWFQFLFKILSF